MSQHTTEDDLKMTPEAQNELIKKFRREILTALSIKVGVSVGVIIAAKAFARHIEKAEQKARK
ncbi:hypothetical protein GORDON_36 [Arthrobacter phage Gordon]|uniref:Uncharacterized protein n=1 Tax=Arthrobacter phage Gordon TaxID=1772298 RepID=A0A0U4K7E2_9CAUD|nr:hypothetical protein FDH69_gp36 [Arthrobacter phage Gordon]ALY09011.1 hypothetical protein GORDON_36 [Arthrobacter phage Gordon]